MDKPEGSAGQRRENENRAGLKFDGSGTNPGETNITNYEDHYSFFNTAVNWLSESREFFV